MGDNQAWELAGINLAGVDTDGGGGGTKLQPGSYAVKIVETNIHDKSDGSGSKSIRFYVETAGGEGAEIYVGMDQTKEGNKRSLKLALLSIGKTVAQTETAGARVTNTTFDGKAAFIAVEAKQGLPDAKGRLPLPDVRFITPERFAADQKKGPAAGANGAAPGQGIPQPSAANVLAGISL